jgi:uncharacterized membrane protein
MKERFHAIDIIRGLIMVIMALDHTRDFLHTPSSPLDMQTTTVILFFTRWVTHYCAPTFVFLSGVSVFLAGQRRSKKELSLFLLKRGVWLILSDLLHHEFPFHLRYPVPYAGAGSIISNRVWDDPAGRAHLCTAMADRRDSYPHHFWP